MTKPILNIIGTNGNTYAILAKARRVARKDDWKTNKWLDFLDEAKSGDYNKLLQTCEKYFEIN